MRPGRRGGGGSRSVTDFPIIKATDSPAESQDRDSDRGPGPPAWARPPARRQGCAGHRRRRPRADSRRPQACISPLGKCSCCDEGALHMNGKSWWAADFLLISITEPPRRPGHTSPVDRAGQLSPCQLPARPFQAGDVVQCTWLLNFCTKYAAADFKFSTVRYPL
jgi:hypothetical protein